MQPQLLTLNVSHLHLIGPEKHLRQAYRKARYRCPKCKTSGEFESLPVPDGQDCPWFQCLKCQHCWRSGPLGGAYAAFLMGKGRPVHHPQRTP